MKAWSTSSTRFPWFLQSGETVVVGDAQPWTRGSIDKSPELSALLDSTTLMPVSIAGKALWVLDKPDHRSSDDTLIYIPPSWRPTPHDPVHGSRHPMRFLSSSELLILLDRCPGLASSSASPRRAGANLASQPRDGRMTSSGLTMP
jgi:hypothetical protein